MNSVGLFRYQVRSLIVTVLSIIMVDDFTRLQLSPQLAFRHDPMFVSISTAVRKVVILSDVT